MELYDGILAACGARSASFSLAAAATVSPPDVFTKSAYSRLKAGVCGKGETRSDGVLSGTTTLGAEDEAGKPIGAWLGGEP